MILDHKGKPIPHTGAGFVKTAPVKPRPPKDEKNFVCDEKNFVCDCVGFTVTADTYYPLIECRQ